MTLNFFFCVFRFVDMTFSKFVSMTFLQLFTNLPGVLGVSSDTHRLVVSAIGDEWFGLFSKDLLALVSPD